MHKLKSVKAVPRSLYALKVDKLDVPQDPSAARVNSAINANQIGQASITARYGR